MELPYILKNQHKNLTKASWKRQGLIMDHFEQIYNDYIMQTNCELCNKKFACSRDRQMEHCHETGEFRNIVCRGCNQRKKDNKMNCKNSSNYKGISKYNVKECKQGFIWRFQASINGKQETIKRLVNKEKLIEFAENWKLENNYYT